MESSTADFRSLSWTSSMGDLTWDKPVVPMPQVERWLFSDADVQRFFLAAWRYDRSRAVSSH
jgi:hypothetical protein